MIGFIKYGAAFGAGFLVARYIYINMEASALKKEGIIKERLNAVLVKNGWSKAEINELTGGVFGDGLDYSHATFVRNNGSNSKR